MAIKVLENTYGVVMEERGARKKEKKKIINSNQRPSWLFRL